MPGARAFLPRFRTEIARLGSGAECVIAREGQYELRYVPFEQVNRNARVALVGITPGPTQVSLSYDALCAAFSAELDDESALTAAKAAGAFGGAMRGRLNQMFRKFRIHKIAGVADPEALWDEALHCTSVVPHAVFKSAKMFNGPFSEVLKTPLLRTSFEADLLPTFSQLPPDTRFIGLGRNPSDALAWCVANGVLRREQVLGSFPHPSGNAGTQVDYFLGAKQVDELDPNDPIRHRLKWLDEARTELQRSIAEALGDATRPIEDADVDALTLAASPRVDRRTSTQGPSPTLLTSSDRSGNGGDLYSVVRRGKAVGTILHPHVHEDGGYVVSPSRFQRDYVRVASLDEVVRQLRLGLSLRMSNPDVESHRAPSLIAPTSIIGWR